MLTDIIISEKVDLRHRVICNCRDYRIGDCHCSSYKQIQMNCTFIVVSNIIMAIIQIAVNENCDIHKM